jgi:hypothetical protein
MPLWLDAQYAKLMGHRLEGWQVKLDSGGKFAANFRCPLCGDSQKNKSKKRGNFFTQENDVYFKCFNCMPDQALHFGTFLKDQDHYLYQQYAVERYKQNTDGHTHTKKDIDWSVKILKVEPTLKSQDILKGTTCVEDLPKGHPALDYVINRQIPEQYWAEIFYAPKFMAWASTNSDRFNLKEGAKDHPRLIIPWFDTDFKIFTYQARAFGKETPKYYTINVETKTNKYFGENRLNPNRRVYVVEGPIDSFFLPNSVAVGSSALTLFDEKGMDVIYCYDNEARNKEIVHIIEKCILEGKKTVLYPDNYIYKDINDAVVKGGMSPKDIVKMLDENTYSGLRARMKFNDWRKV